MPDNRQLHDDNQILVPPSFIALFSDARARLREFTLLKADVTANSAADRALLARFQLFGPPGIIFFDAQGREISSLRVVGFQPAAQFLPVLERALR